MPTISAGDLQVAYDERGAGEPVVFVHGNWASRSWWQPLLARLAAGQRGIAYDMRGRGATSGPDSSYAIPALADDLAQFAVAMGLDRFHLVGHSLGSAVAMQYALAHPARVRSLAVIAPAWIDGMPAAYANAASQTALHADRELFGRAIKALAPAAPDDTFWQQLVAEGHTQRLSAALANLDALLAWQPGDTLRQIAAPALVICGEHDSLTGGANAQRAAAALGAPLIVMPGIGHSPNIEAPEELAALLRTFWINNAMHRRSMP